MSDYYTEFRNFDLHAKQIDSVVQAILDLDFGSSETFRFVDVGSNDGELTSRILKSFSGNYDKVEVYAFEPDQEAYRRLQTRFQNDIRVQIDNLNFEQWLEKYKSQINSGIDLVLNSHSFYHFRPESWESIITQSGELLTPDGRHVIIIDSERTSINQLKSQLDESIGSERKTGEYGEFLFGTDVETFFKSQGIDYEHQVIEHPITIPKNEVAVHNFARILGFVFRYRTEDILQHAQPKISEFMEPFRQNGEYRFPRCQDMFVL